MRVAALLRGVNIGSHKRIGMAALRATVESLGHRDVETYLQSGNVVFTPAAGAPKHLGAQLERAIADATGHDVPVVVRSGKERSSSSSSWARRSSSATSAWATSARTSRTS
jgi:uncharacterized protein (DUF1697 family)